ncbi:thiamine pyrophosphate-binding protein [Methylobacterium nodulans]|uniref:Thiamine pyrophosphate protein central region n=1 Tax=Methylobacterium nodulans (strain LMG 21967 / CNCM I-2342 / ORS 2060) TaxID=460265 RepID=B8IW65_METNO|nr:thiamine pyrophosphate-binding protein [Methylobacterium nodulans]ACL62655.1 thiamine pyrophosphate protein central region [Methylobacterium nodulans ORS 2060]
MPRMKGGEVIAEYLVKQKVPYVFGICGHGNVGILDAMHAVRDEVTLVSPRHEQCAGHMADAYFRIRHQPVATLTSTGPGSANMVMSLATALSDSSAFLAITANVPTSQANRAPFQELYAHNQADFAQVLRPVVKRSFQPSRVDMLPLALRQAFDTMVTGRPGPVNLDIPYNVFQEEAETEVPPLSHVHGAHRPAASEADVARALELLAAARKPVFFIGQGTTLADAGPEISALQQRLGIPVITSPNGMGCVPADDPLTLGFIGRNGAYPANQAGRHADLVLCIGTRFDDRSSSTWHPGYSWNFPTTKLIQVDIDPAELGRNYPPTLGIIADAKAFAGQLNDALVSRSDLSPETWATWRAEIAGWQAEWDAFVRPNFSAITTPIRPEYVVGTLQAALPDDVILSLDSGVHHNWFMQFWRPRRPRSMLNSWGYSSMGFGVCGVLGAQLAAPDRPCVAVVGDGGFMMAPYVVATAVEYNLPCVWIVWNNFAWGAIRDLQYGLFEGREHGTAFYKGNQGPGGERYNPDFAAWARACGADGVTVTRSQDLAGAVEAAVRNRRPCVIDVHVDAEVRPPSTGTWQLPPIPFKEPVFGAPYRPS